MNEEMNNILNEEEEEASTVTLTYDDGTEEECIVMDIFSVEELGEQEYIALLSIPENLEEIESDEVESEVMIYRYQELENDEISLDTIEDENEAGIVAAAFEALLDAEEEEE